MKQVFDLLTPLVKILDAGLIVSDGKAVRHL